MTLYTGGADERGCHSALRPVRSDLAQCLKYVLDCSCHFNQLERNSLEPSTAESRIDR